MRPITPTEQRVFDELKAYIEREGYPPSIRELGKLANLTFSGIPVYLERLKERGLIEWQRGHYSSRIKLVKNDTTDQQ